MKPLLIIPPAPARWPALEHLLAGLPAEELADVEKRFRVGLSPTGETALALPGSPPTSAAPTAAFAVVPDGGQMLACGAICRSGPIGVLSHLRTRNDQRAEALADAVLTTLLSWWQMTGGQRLYSFEQPGLSEQAGSRHSFQVLFPATTIAASNPQQTPAILYRLAPGLATDPYCDTSGQQSVRELSRADWPLIIALLVHRPGADPRVPLAESAATAMHATLGWVDQQERGACRIFGVFCGPLLAGLGTLATNALGERTYAMMLPHNEALPALRIALVEFAQSKGYRQVDFPLEIVHAG